MDPYDLTIIKKKFYEKSSEKTSSMYKFKITCKNYSIFSQTKILKD